MHRGRDSMMYPRSMSSRVGFFVPCKEISDGCIQSVAAVCVRRAAEGRNHGKAGPADLVVASAIARPCASLRRERIHFLAIEIRHGCSGRFDSDK